MRRVEIQNFLKFSAVKPSICRGWGFSFKSRSSAIADQVAENSLTVPNVCVQISKQIKQSWSQREETRTNLDEDIAFSPVRLRILWVPRKNRFENTISTLNINFSLYSPSSTRRVALSQLGCPTLEDGQWMVGIRESIIPSRSNISYFCASRRCCDSSPGTLGSGEGYFHVWIVVWIDVSDGGPGLEIPCHFATITPPSFKAWQQKLKIC